LYGGQCGLEECRCPSAARRISVLACAFGQCPKRPSMTVFGSLLFEPAAVVAHEISEPAGVRIPRMLDECGKACSDRLGQLRFAGIRKGAGKQEGTGVIINTVAMGAIWNAM